ncbi:hypothetical protein ZWY2020_023625 [Hordeum vulgare]|nr:hypothetical protein ZWY2020_023625 [Hordeum vulgare]
MKATGRSIRTQRRPPPSPLPLPPYRPSRPDPAATSSPPRPTSRTGPTSLPTPQPIRIQIQPPVHLRRSALAAAEDTSDGGYLATYTAKDPATPAQPAVQTASELPARAAGGHAQQAPGAAALPASSRGAVKSNISSVKTPGSSSNKRVIYIVDGDDGSHVPTLRQVQVYGEEGSKGYEMTPAPASNVVKQPRLDAGKQPVRRPRIQLISNMHQGQSTELMDDDEEASMALAVKLERNASYVDRSLQLETAEEFDVMEIDDLSSDDTGSESDSDSGSGSESEKEEGKFFYPGPEELGTVKAPQVGMKFPTLEDALSTTTHMLSRLVSWWSGEETTRDRGFS